MNKENGITLTILVITIVVMLILVGSISFYSISAYELEQYNKMYSDIKILEDEIAIYYVKNDEIPITDNKINIESLISEYNQDNINYNPNNSGELYEIDLKLLENVKLNNERYYIDEQSHTIYSEKSYSIDGIDYYTIPVKYTRISI